MFDLYVGLTNTLRKNPVTDQKILYQNGGDLSLSYTNFSNVYPNSPAADKGQIGMTIRIFFLNFKIKIIKSTLSNVQTFFVKNDEIFSRNIKICSQDETTFKKSDNQPTNDVKVMYHVIRVADHVWKHFV